MRSPTLAYPGNPQWGIRVFESNYDRPRRVEVVNLTGILAGLWFKLFHCAEFSTLTLPAATLAIQCEKTCRCFLPDAASVQQVMSQFKARFGQRKRIRKTVSNTKGNERFRELFAIFHTKVTDNYTVVSENSFNYIQSR